MAIRSTVLGGTDIALKEAGILSADWNDTFDAVASKITTLSTFWLNSDLYDVYDNFDAYDTGDMSTNTNWTVTTAVESGDNAEYQGAYVSETQQAGGSTKELRVTGSASAFGTGLWGECTVTSKLLASNKHTHAKIRFVTGSGSNVTALTFTISVGNGTDGFTNIYTYNINTANLSGLPQTMIMLIAKGSNAYDTYIGGLKVSTSLSLANGAQLKFYCKSDADSALPIYIYVDYVIQSQNEVT